MAALPDYLVPILKRIAEKEGFAEFTTDVGSGSNVGDNFLGELLTAAISGKQKQKDGTTIDATLNLLCKLAPSNAQRRKEFLADVVFDRETYFYNVVAPEFIRFQQEKGLADDEQFKAFPKCYEAIHDPENEVYAVIMEDLRPEGFGMWPKQKPTPPAYSRLFVRELAKLHAISFAMKDQEPEKFEKFKKLDDILKKFSESASRIEFFTNCYDRAIDALDDEKPKEIMKDIRNNIPEYIELCLGEEAANRNGVIAHGDCWNNNLLFRANKELDTVEDICFVDWQIMRYAPPLTDLLYNLFSSTDKKTRDEEFSNYIHDYYDQLSNNIRKMGSDPDKIFPYEAFKKELKLSGNIAFLLTPMLIEISQAESKDVSNLDQMCEEMANGDGELKLNLISGLSDSAKIIYHQRINDSIGDLTRHGYFQKLKK